MAAAAPSNSEMGADVRKNVEEVGRLQEGGFVVDVVDDDKLAEAGCAAPAAAAAAAAMVTLNGSPFTARVKRPSHRKKDEGALEEVLSVQLTLARHQFYHMNLFINLPSASEATPIASCPQFASAFNHTPLIMNIAPGGAAADDHDGDVGHLALAPQQHTTLFRVGISDIVSQLGLSLHPYLLVTFVPTGRFKDAPLTIDNITIDLE